MIDQKETIQRFQSNLLNKKIKDVDLGKKSPQNIDMEKAVLAAIMIDKEAIDTVREILAEASFYMPTHQKIFSAALNLSARNEPIDIGVLAEQLAKEGTLEMIGGPAYLIELSNTIASSANVEFHSRIVAQEYIQRELIKLGNETIEDAYDNTKDVFELLDEAESKIYKLADNYTSKDPTQINSVLIEAIGKLKERVNIAKENKIQGVQTGFRKLDDLTGGWQKSDLIIVAGRPGMGKTAFTLALARNASVMDKKSVAFFSLEMSTHQILQRMISMESEIDQTKIQRGTLTPAEIEQITTKIGSLNKASLFIDDTAGLSVMDFRKKVRKIKREKGLDLIIVDYLQLMTANVGDGRGKSITNREQEIAFISRSLKAIAKELEIPVIALAQLSRQAEQRGSGKKGARPMLSDLRESGSIEQDADMVIFLYRPEYYDKEAVDEEGNSLKGIAEIIVEKHRNGETDTVKARFIGQYVKYADYDESFGPAGGFDNFSSNSNFGSPTQGDPFALDDHSKGSTTMTIPSKMNDDSFDNDFINEDY
jgi:replicative DNA helicase